MASTAANHIKYLLATKVISFSADTFKIMLAKSGYVFDKDTHHNYDVANELATGFGYTRPGIALTLVAVTEDDIDDRTEVTWQNASWTAAGGSIGPTPGAIIYDITAAGSPIIGYIDFGGEQTQVDGGIATVSNLEFRVA